MDLGLKDKVVVCMSSASGFGKGIATEFAREGAKVVICTSEAFKAELDQAVVDIEKETGNRPYPYMYDVLNNESIAAMINKVAEDLGGIYGLVNHCPGPKAGTFEALTEADWADGYQKCLYSYTTAIRAALPVTSVPLRTATVPERVPDAAAAGLEPFVGAADALPPSPALASTVPVA